MCATNLWNSPIWSVIFPHDITRRCYDGIAAGEYLARHQTDDGLSFGVIDTQYEYKTAEGQKNGGSVVQDFDNKEAGKEEIDARIDSPHVSITPSFDAASRLDGPSMGPLVALSPSFAAVGGLLRAFRSAGSADLGGEGEREGADAQRDGDEEVRSGTGVEEDGELVVEVCVG